MPQKQLVLEIDHGLFIYVVGLYETTVEAEAAALKSKAENEYDRSPNRKYLIIPAREVI